MMLLLSALARVLKLAKLRWLHISDVHLGHGAREHHRRDQNDVIKALQADAEYIALRGVPDIVFLSGDLAFSGKPSEYEATVTWLRGLLSAMDAPDARIFAVPGNHDVNRGAIDWLSGVVHSRIEANSAEVDDLLRDQRAVAETILPKFAAFNAFCLQMGLRGTSAQELGWREEFQSEVGKVVVVGLNSAVLSRFTEEKGRLHLGSQQLSLLREEPNGFLFVMLHHPLSWLADGDANQLLNLFTKSPEYPTVRT